MIKSHFYTVWILLLVAAGTLAAACLQASSEGEDTSVADQIAMLENSCATSASAREQRHADKPLYYRLGEYERIRELTGEIVDLHLRNETIGHLFQRVDTARLADHVADFVSAGTGGPQVYEGRDMRAAHAHLELTNGHFLAAGGDVGQAMKNLGFGQDEIEEVVCILVSLRKEVVRP